MSHRTIPSSLAGSLPRPGKLVRLMFAVADDIPVDPSALNAAIDDGHHRSGQETK